MGLGVNLAGLIAWVVSFGLFIWMAHLIGYKPIMRMLDQRAQRIKESLEKADRVKDESAKAEELVKQQLDQARAEGRQIVAQAQEVANRLREEETARAKAEAGQIVARARSEIQRERDEAVEAVRRQFADLTVTAAERLIRASLNAEQHRRLIDEVLQEGRNIGRN